MALLGGGSFIGTPLTRTLLGHELSHFGGCCSLCLVGSGFLRLVPPRKWEVQQDNIQMSSLSVRDIPELCKCDNRKAVLGFY
jgi:hypothetical protein